jgi:hypothetical protein
MQTCPNTDLSRSQWHAMLAQLTQAEHRLASRPQAQGESRGLMLLRVHCLREKVGILRTSSNRFEHGL